MCDSQHLIILVYYIIANQWHIQILFMSVFKHLLNQSNVFIHCIKIYSDLKVRKS